MLMPSFPFFIPMHVTVPGVASGSNLPKLEDDEVKDRVQNQR